MSAPSPAKCKVVGFERAAEPCVQANVGSPGAYFEIGSFWQAYEALEAQISPRY